MIYNPLKEVRTKNSTNNTDTQTKKEEKIKEGYSPYNDKIRMSNISGLSNDDPGNEYLSLSVRLKENETVNITGWYLKSEVSGNYVQIGRAALLPILSQDTGSDIILKMDDRVYLTKGFSPIGISFRTNKCTGYFEENRTFVPSLSLNCPRAADENLPTFSTNYEQDEECIDAIERIPRCQTRGTSFTRDLPDIVPQSCKNYIENQINYNSCIALHMNDEDFAGNEYRIYLNKFGPLWRTRSDKISLYDSNNLVVDTIDY